MHVQQSVEHPSRTLYTPAARADTPHMKTLRNTLHKTGDLLYAITYATLVAIATIAVGELAVMQQATIGTEARQGLNVMVLTVGVLAGVIASALIRRRQRRAQPPIPDVHSVAGGHPGEREPGEYARALQRSRAAAARIDQALGEGRH